MGFQLVPKASEARSLLDCAALAIPSRPAQHLIQSKDINAQDSKQQNNPVLMPWVGFGTYRLGQRKSRSATYQALDVGYRHIDTAFIYGGQTTEIEVGKAIRDALQHGLIKNREELFVTTKQWRDHHGYDASLQCLDLSLERLGLEYVDCWMMHWPGPCWKNKPRQEKQSAESNQEGDGEGDDLWQYAEDGMGKGKAMLFLLCWIIWIVAIH